MVLKCEGLEAQQGEEVGFGGTLWSRKPLEGNDAVGRSPWQCGENMGGRRECSEENPLGTSTPTETW